MMKKALPWIGLRIGLAAGLAVAMAQPAAATGVRIESPDRDLALEITGWVQPRYELSRAEDGDERDDRSSFLLRRARLDVRGHVFSDQLTFRIMPELARTAELRDGWINYRVSEAFELRAGQFTVPFQWHRHVSPRRQHFAERGVPSESFGMVNGRDVGVMAHGRNAGRTLQYGFGVFDGAGRNVARSDSSGNLASGRLSVAVLGTVPSDETDFERSPEPRLAFGAGLQGATRNSVRAWDLGRSPTGNRQADWYTATGDVAFRWQGLSLVTDFYRREVSPDDPTVDDYTGRAYMVSAGYAVLPGRLEAVGRYSALRLDTDDPNSRQTEWGAGLNYYHRGHDLKTRLQYFHQRFDRPGDSPTAETIVLEWHVQF